MTGQALLFKFVPESTGSSKTCSHSSSTCLRYVSSITDSHDVGNWGIWWLVGNLKFLWRRKPISRYLKKRKMPIKGLIEIIITEQDTGNAKSGSWDTDTPQPNRDRGSHTLSISPSFIVFYTAGLI